MLYFKLILIVNFQKSSFSVFSVFGEQNNIMIEYSIVVRLYKILWMPILLKCTANAYEKMPVLCCVSDQLILRITLKP